jgi:hypothetical protein
MLDFDRLTTPPRPGDVLIEPRGDGWPTLTDQNRATLARARFRFLDLEFTDVRRQVRAVLGCADDAPLILIGHQPEFIHPGVWAKHVVAYHAARQLGGRCVNLVVDNDAPKDPFIRVPVEHSPAVELRAIRYASFPAGIAFESIPPADRAALHDFEQQIRAALGDRFARSMMPVFLEGMRAVSTARDWPDQSIAGRRAVEARFDIRPADLRVSAVWGGPLLYDMLANAGPFATAYNAALRDYRQARRIRNPQRPIPDLAIQPQRCELPVWAYRRGEVRRRLFVEAAGDERLLLAEQETITRLRRRDLQRAANAEGALRATGFCLRPRALTLTLWARLLAADLFVHGIGGAKYDEITDHLIRRYYGVTPPQIACVSATLHLDLNAPDVDARDLQRAEYLLRDLRCNPQRHLHGDGRLREYALARHEAVNESVRLRAADPQRHDRRRAAFNRIHSINAQMLQLLPAAIESAARQVGRMRSALGTAGIARNRELFFALWPAAVLEMLVARLDDAFGATR